MSTPITIDFSRPARDAAKHRLAEAKAREEAHAALVAESDETPPGWAHERRALTLDTVAIQAEIAMLDAVVAHADACLDAIFHREQPRKS